MPNESTQDIRIVLYNADAGGKVAASLSSFLAFDREITQASALLVQRWIDRVPKRAIPQDRIIVSSDFWL